MEERRPILVVVNAGGEHSFLGRIDNPSSTDTFSEASVIEGFNDDADEGNLVAVYDAFPIGNQQVMGPHGPMRAPALGTMDWCILEPIKNLYVMPKWYYFIDEQSKLTRDEFLRIYVGFMKEINGAMAQHQMETANLQKASPEDLKRMEDHAKKLGLGTGPDLVAALKSGGKLIR